MRAPLLATATSSSPLYVSISYLRVGAVSISPDALISRLSPARGSKRDGMGEGKVMGVFFGVSRWTVGGGGGCL